MTCSSLLPPQIREQNLQDIKTAGPQSQVLCGVVMDRSLVQVSTGNSLWFLPVSVRTLCGRNHSHSPWVVGRAPACLGRVPPALIACLVDGTVPGDQHARSECCTLKCWAPGLAGLFSSTLLCAAERCLVPVRGPWRPHFYKGQPFGPLDGHRSVVASDTVHSLQGR